MITPVTAMRATPATATGKRRLKLGKTAAEPVAAQEGDSAASAPGYVLTFGDSERGKALFTGKGCVVCHAINGVGGAAGPVEVLRGASRQDSMVGAT